MWTGFVSHRLWASGGAQGKVSCKTAKRRHRWKEIVKIVVEK